MEKKILVIDDEPELRTVLKARLESQHFTVVMAADGEEGLEQVKKEGPDLIVLDIMMPRMDGFTFFGIKEARACPRYSCYRSDSQEDDGRSFQARRCDRLCRQAF